MVTRIVLYENTPVITGLQKDLNYLLKFGGKENVMEVDT